jgi:signal transduction histidine kinase
MIFYKMSRSAATTIRLVGLGLIIWSVVASRYPPTGSGRGLLVTVALVVASIGFFAWLLQPSLERGLSLDLYVMVAAGGVLVGAAPDSAASAYVFVAIVAAGLRAELPQASPLALLGLLAVAASSIAYDEGAIGVLAYALGFAAATFGASNARQSLQRAEQAELLLAQTERSREEALRVARLEESTRIAREIHDVLAHSLAGLTLQLEATSALLQRGADPQSVLERVKRAHELARDGLRETRYAVGALRGEPVSLDAALGALVAEYRASVDAPIELAIDGDVSQVPPSAVQATARIVQEALTNVRKHAPGAAVNIALGVTEAKSRTLLGGAAAGELVLRVLDTPVAGADSALASSGGGYGIRGMRERAEILGGTLEAGLEGGGWLVELRLPLAVEGRAGQRVATPSSVAEAAR